MIFGFENYVAYLQGMAYLQNVASERVMLYWSIKVNNEAEQRRKSYAKERKECFIYDIKHKGDVIWYSKLSFFFFFQLFPFQISVLSKV